MSQLLVSVRNVIEAKAALRGGAAVIDLKEPRNGSLGAADPSQWHQVYQLVGNAVPVSVAMGELLDESAVELVRELPPVSYAKVGLAGCQSQFDWTKRWKSVLSGMPNGVSPVAVSYADWQLADSPPPEDVLLHAHALGCRVILWDTFDKERGCLFDHFNVPELGELVTAARQHKLIVAIAGSLRLSHLSFLSQLQPDLVAVRGAVCDSDRCGEVRQELVARFSQALDREQVVGSCELPLSEN